MSRLSNIDSWKGFSNQVRKTEKLLLKNLDIYKNSILVAGCQRSGTTMLARVITKSEGIDSYKLTHDDELDAALILSGEEEIDTEGKRYCFQTTYVNECYQEYFSNSGHHKMIWVVRNPYSVIYSFLNNWGSFAFNELFRSCGLDLLLYGERNKLNLFGIWRISKLKRACLSYIGKNMQLEELAKGMQNIDLMVVEYDDLVSNKDKVLPEIYEFVGLEYDKSYGDAIKVKSIGKADAMCESDKAVVTMNCGSLYKEIKAMRNKVIRSRHA